MSADLDPALKTINRIILGKEKQVKLAMACLLAKGHLLIEDLPGMGKTTLSQVLAKVLGLEYQRVQFTSDLLPADIIGTSIFDKNEGRFQFHPGPIFTQILLADEINRATPKAQGALLEAMEENQVTAEGKTRPLSNPFFVIATQNPITQMGTYPLPESQLDRFLMRISMGYPDRLVEKELIMGEDRRDMLQDITTHLTQAHLVSLQNQVAKIHMSESVVDYVQRLVELTRKGGAFSFGLSPRGTLALVKAAKAWAFIEGRNHVIPEDVQEVLTPVVEHRLRGSADHTGHEGKGLAHTMLNSVDVIIK